MTQRTDEQLTQEINNRITTNGNNEITGADVNSILTDIVDSKMNNNNWPAWSNTEIQYNDNGSFGCSSDFTYDNTTKVLSLDLEVAPGQAPQHFVDNEITITWASSSTANDNFNTSLWSANTSEYEASYTNSGLNETTSLTSTTTMTTYNHNNQTAGQDSKRVNLTGAFNQLRNFWTAAYTFTDTGQDRSKTKILGLSNQIDEEVNYTSGNKPSLTITGIRNEINFTPSSSNNSRIRATVTGLEQIIQGPTTSYPSNQNVIGSNIEFIDAVHWDSIIGIQVELPTATTGDVFCFIANGGTHSVRINLASQIWTVVRGAVYQTENLSERRAFDESVVASVRSNGAIQPASLADIDAANDSIYFSTTQSKLVYKDSSWTVNDLY